MNLAGFQSEPKATLWPEVISVAVESLPDAGGNF